VWTSDVARDDHNFMNLKIRHEVSEVRIVSVIVVIKFDETCNGFFFKRGDLKSDVQKDTEKSEDKSAYVESFSRHTKLAIRAHNDTWGSDIREGHTYTYWGRRKLSYHALYTPQKCAKVFQVISK
jgi:hypothetical protein